MPRTRAQKAHRVIIYQNYRHPITDVSVQVAVAIAYWLRSWSSIPDVCCASNWFDSNASEFTCFRLSSRVRFSARRSFCASWFCPPYGRYGRYDTLRADDARYLRRFFFHARFMRAARQNLLTWIPVNIKSPNQGRVTGCSTIRNKKI